MITEIVKVENIFPNYIQVSGSTTIIYIESFKLSNLKFNMANLHKKDELKVVHDTKGTLTFVKLHKCSHEAPIPIVKTNSNPFLNVAPDLTTPGRQSVLIKIVEKTINNLQPIFFLSIPKESKEALNIFFESFRKITYAGANNLVLAIIVSIIDYSITYSTSEMIDIMKEIIIKNNSLLLPESERSLEILEKVQSIIKTQATIYSKLLSLTEIYDNLSYDLAVLLRNIIKISFQMKYFTKQYESYKMMNEFNYPDANAFIEKKKVLEAQCAFLSIEDYYFMMDNLGIQLRMIDANDLNVMSQGSGTKHVLHIFSQSDGVYYPIYTTDESYLHKANSNDYSEMLQFLRSNQESDNKIVNQELASLEIQLNEAENNKKNAAKVFLALHNRINPGTTLEETLKPFAGLNKDYEIRNVLTEFTCSTCGIVKSVVEYSCGHYFCEQHVLGQYEFQGSIYCSYCAIPTDFTVVQKFLNSYGY